MAKLVIFDMDGTLIDSMPLWGHAGSNFLREKGIDPAPDTDDIAYSMSVSGFADFIRRKYRMAESQKEITAQIEAFINDGYKRLSERRGARELLLSLKRLGVKAVLATSSGESLAKPTLERLSMWDFFERKYCDAQKNSAAFFEGVAQDMGLSPRDICVAEDAPYSAACAAAAWAAACWSAGVTGAAGVESKVKVGTYSCSFMFFLPFF